MKTYTVKIFAATNEVLNVSGCTEWGPYRGDTVFGSEQMDDTWYFEALGGRTVYCHNAPVIVVEDD